MPILLVIASLALGLPLFALYGSSSMRTGAADLATSGHTPFRRTAEPAGRHGYLATLDLGPSELEGVSSTLGMLDAVRSAVASLPMIAASTTAVSAKLNGTLARLDETSARLEEAFTSIERLSLQVAALQEPWTGHGSQMVKCASGHRCASYIDAGKENLTAIMSVSACRDYCTYAYPAAGFFAFHNEHGYIAFMLDPKGRCRCYADSPCELVPDGGYTLWTSGATCSTDLQPKDGSLVSH